MVLKPENLKDSVESWIFSVGSIRDILKQIMRIYSSPIPDPQALAVDTFLQNWINLFLYLFPPNKVLRFRENHSSQAI